MECFYMIYDVSMYKQYYSTFWYQECVCDCCTRVWYCFQVYSSFCTLWGYTPVDCALPLQDTWEKEAQVLRMVRNPF